MGTLNDKLDAAFAALITLALGENSPATVVTARNAGVKASLPLIICDSAADDFDDPMGSGNFSVTTSITIKTSAVTNSDGTDTQPEADQAAAVKASAEALLEAVSNAIQVDNLAELLNDAGENLTVFPGSVQFGAPDAGYDDKGRWNDVLRVKYYACGSSLAE